MKGEVLGRRALNRALLRRQQLCDLGDGRITQMDAAGIDVQVLEPLGSGTQASVVSNLNRIQSSRSS
jgi:hypothetical protein